MVEGSVARAGNKVRVSVQLIDARNDTHLWAEHYDRDVEDVFAIQTEVAQQIADQLQAEALSCGKSRNRGTADWRSSGLCPLYRGQGHRLDQSDWEGAEKPATEKWRLLEKATQRDPNFALAYCTLAQNAGRPAFATAI